MNKPSRKTLLREKHQPWSLPIILLSGLLLSACDSVPNEPTVTGGGSGSTAAAYTGEACNAVATNQTTVEDICNFQTEFWAKMLDASQCENCHNTETGSQEPYFMDTAEINTAYGEVISRNLVDRTTPANSAIITKINANHNCGSPSECAVLATNATNYISNWISGGVAGAGTGTETNEIALTAPTIKDTGKSKNLPPIVLGTDSAPAGFSSVYNLLVTNCSNCHRESASVPQTPFFADADIDIAYDAIVASQKINLDIPQDSRLVARMDEGHNCWDLAMGGSGNPTVDQQAINEGRKNCAIEMQLAIETFAGTVGTDEVPTNWVTSKAMSLLDGIVASGGARDDSSTIALYEFKTGSGNTILDTSGVGVPLNLTLYGNEGTDYSWVGGWGVEFHTGSAKAQANTQDSRKLLTSILGSGEYSIEAWLVPANVSQGTAGDPARIINYSGGSSERNFTLGQAEYRYEFMNRTSTTNANAAPSFITDADDEDLQSTQQHVVVTFSLTEGRKVYVNGEDVSTTGNADVDTFTPIGNLTGWDPTYAFSMGNEADFSEPWEGKLRLVAIHNRAMTPTQIQQNFDAGVGQKFFLMFSVSDEVGDPNCFLTSAITETNPRGEQCFVYFVASQFDTYSYLFTDPTFVSLNPAFTPSGTVVKGMRIGLNGKEPAVGQAFVNLDTTLNAGAYDAASGTQVLSNVGTIIAVEKGAGSDEFFLTFEDFGGNQDVRVASICGVNMTCNTTPPTAPTTPAPRVGLRTFEEILVSMSAMTGVDPYDTGRYPNVLKTYYEENAGIVSGIKQALPSTEDVNGFLAAHEMAVAQLAIAYCDALVDDVPKRDTFFSPFSGFGSPVATAFDTSAKKYQIVDALYDKMVGIGGTALSNMPSQTELRNELVDAPAAGDYPGNLYDRLFSACAADTSCSNDTARTSAVVKAMCTSVLGSAAMIIQ